MQIHDAHAHVWPRWPHAGTIPDPTTRGTVELLLFEMDRAGVEKAVLIGAALSASPDDDAYCAAAVAAHPDRFYHFLDAESRWSAEHHRPGSAARLAARLEAQPAAGISHYLRPDNDGWLRAPGGRELFAVAQRFGLPVSLGAGPDWLADVIASCREFPDVPVLLNHLGLLGRLSGDRARLDAHLEELASTALPAKLWVKVSGLHHGATRPWAYPYEDELHLVRRLYELFGPSRMAWGSDYPGVLDALTYRQSLEVLREHAGFAGPPELDRMLGTNMRELLC